MSEHGTPENVTTSSGRPLPDERSEKKKKERKKKTLVTLKRSIETDRTKGIKKKERRETAPKVRKARAELKQDQRAALECVIQMIQIPRRICARVSRIQRRAVPPIVLENVHKRLDDWEKERQR